MNSLFLWIPVLLGPILLGGKPNVVIILSDDMGYSDVGCYGGEIRTPNLDSLAENGLRFSQFYNTARCCPTRASLLSGLYQHQAGIGLMTGDKKLPGYRGEIGRSVLTIAEALGLAGYKEYMSGKVASPATSGPRDRRIIGPASVGSTGSTGPSSGRAVLRPRHSVPGEHLRYSG